MEQHLQAIDANLMWEFGRDAENQGHYLVITPERCKHLRPLVETILDKAPALPGWTFHGYRRPESLEVALATVEGRTGAPLPDTAVHAQIGEWHRIDLAYQSRDFDGPDDEVARHQAFVASETLLGEEMLDKWVGAIEVTQPARGIRPIPLGRLQETVGALVGAIREQLPAQPCYTFGEDRQWSGLELHPEGAEDYPGKGDLLVAVTMVPDVLTSFLNGPPFCSSSFSRCGERFCYVKVDGTRDIDQMAFADREEMERALDRVLKPARVGCVVGGGTGLRYSYIDLALMNVEAGSRLVRQALQAGRIPKRTWLLFFDCEWEDEWIGIWDDTPPPCTVAR
jgi:hypothetical protein